MEGGRSAHDSFYVLPPEEERLEVGRHLRHRLSVISEVSEESSPASTPHTSPQRNINNPSLHSLTPPATRRQTQQEDFLSEEFRNVTTNICRNLAYNLAQHKSRDCETYARLVDSVVVGPSMISDTEIERRLGVDSSQYHKSRRKRESLREAKTKLGWEFDDDRNDASSHQQGFFLFFKIFSQHLSVGGAVATAQDTAKQKTISFRKGFNQSYSQRFFNHFIFLLLFSSL